MRPSVHLPPEAEPSVTIPSVVVVDVCGTQKKHLSKQKVLANVVITTNFSLCCDLRVVMWHPIGQEPACRTP